MLKFTQSAGLISLYGMWLRTVQPWVSHSKETQNKTMYVHPFLVVGGGSWLKKTYEAGIGHLMTNIELTIASDGRQLDQSCLFSARGRRDKGPTIAAGPWDTCQGVMKPAIT